jgi:hypothetical protein
MCLRQGLVAYGLGAGLIASAIAAAVVGSLVAAGVSRLTDIKVDFPVDEIDHIDIDLPGTVLEYKEAQEVSEKEEKIYLKKNTKRKSQTGVQHSKYKLGSKKWRKSRGSKFLKIS